MGEGYCCPCMKEQAMREGSLEAPTRHPIAWQDPAFTDPVDRALREVRRQAGGGLRRRAAPSAEVRRSVPVRTFADWDDPAPGFMEADLVAHSGPTADGSFVQTLTKKPWGTRDFIIRDLDGNLLLFAGPAE